MRDLHDSASTRYYRKREIALIRSAFGDLRGKRVLKLDLWNEAFNTRILHWIRQQEAEAWGIDVSSVVVERAEELARSCGLNLRLVNGDIRELPFPDGAFDHVYTMGTIEHVPEYRQALREVHRVLRKGGSAIIGVPYKWDPMLRPAFVYLMDLLGMYPYAPEKSFSSAELRDAVEQSGLRVCYRTGILTLPGILRMIDLFLHIHGIPAHGLISPVVQPFEWFETRFRWAGHLGYLLVQVARKE